MKFSVAARAIATGFVAAVVISSVGMAGSLAQIKNDKTKSVVAKAAQQPQEQKVKLRYYGGPKSPMFQ
jgi:ribosomal protein L30E